MAKAKAESTKETVEAKPADTTPEVQTPAVEKTTEIKKTEVKGLLPKLYELQTKLFGAQVFKNGKNTFSNYNYSTKEDVVASIRDAVLESGLLFLPTYGKPEISDVFLNKTNKQGEVSQEKRTRVNIDCTYMIIDPESGDRLDLNFPGSSEDTQDKAIWKTYTGIQKYFWMKLFNLQDNDLTTEPENDDPRDRNVPEDDKAKTFAALKKAIELNKEVNWDAGEKYFAGTPYEAEFKKLKGESSMHAA